MATHTARAIEDDGLLASWARFAVRRRWYLLAAWAVLLVLLTVASRKAGGSFVNNFTIPGTETQRASDLLAARFPQLAGDTATVVFKADAGATDPSVEARIQPLLKQSATLPHVVGVSSPYDPSSPAISQDGTIAYANVQYDNYANKLPKDTANPLIALVDGANGNGLRVEVGGPMVTAHEQGEPALSEALGLLAAVFILLLAFGSVVAMGLPIATALFGLGVSFALVAFSAKLLSLPVFTTSFATMIGLGVGIDYALLIVTRYREALHAGHSVEESVAQSISGAGRSVLFAGSAVCVAMLGMLTNGIPFVGALGIAGALVVGTAVLIALTLMPALLAFAGTRIDRWGIAAFMASDESGGDNRQSVWYRLSVMIQRHPIRWFSASLALVVLLALPVFHMHLGASDAGNNPTSLHSRRAYDLLSEGFGPGFNGPLKLVVDLRGAANPSQTLGTLRTTLAQTPGVAAVSAPILNQAKDAAVLSAIPSTSPEDTKTEQLVHDLRRQVLPPVMQGSGAHVYVSGPTAGFIDISDRVISRLPLFFAAIIGVSFVLLTMVFRSPLVSLKAAIMNLLSIAAAYGVLIAVFQWGWLSGPIGVKAGPIESYLPMMLFAILFGLSMDYEVFLISRIREEYLETRDNADSVSHGLAATARVITAAASIMVVVFLCFVFGDNRTIKEFGLGLATAVFVDATVVRLILVPATMEMLGDANWWLPAWLDRILPRLDLEGPRVQPVPQPAVQPASGD